MGNFVENRKERSPQTPAREAAAQLPNRELACNEFPIPGSRFPKNCVREISESHGGNSGGGSSSRDSSQQPRNYSRVMQLCSCRVALRQWR